MISPALPRNVSFTIETMFANNGGRVGKIVPDANGFYRGLPMLVLGVPTENKTLYDVASITSKMNDPNSKFYKTLRNNQLFGEWGHPNFLDYDEDKQLARLMLIREERHSHMIDRLSTGRTLENGGVIVAGDILPVLPYGPALKESLDHPCINTGFSLRAWINTEIRGGIKHRTVNKMVTIDAVGAGGYPDASKKNALGLEDYNEYSVEVMRNGQIICDEIAIESLEETELNDIFGMSSITRLVQTRTLIDADPVMSQSFPSQYGRTVFHDYFKVGSK